MRDPARVVLLSLDAFNHHVVSPELTPRLWALGEAGGRAPDGGRCDLPSVTYPSHATLLTGRLPRHHGVRSNLAASPRSGAVPGWAGETRVLVPTLFDACRTAGLRSAAILGDHKLYGIVGAGVADHVWPDGGAVPAGTALDAYGYPTNGAIRPYLLAAAGDGTLPFLFGHINETDTWGHRFGPDAPESLAAHTAADALIGEVIDALRDDWARTVLIVVSDHGMEPMADAESIDLLADAAARAVIAAIVDEGGSAQVRLRPGIDASEAGELLSRVDGVAGCQETAPDVLLVEAGPGRLFATGFTKSLRGIHGGSGTTRTTAVVGGGHAAVPAIAAAIRASPPRLVDWAPTIAAVLGLGLRGADGRNLAAR